MFQIAGQQGVIPCTPSGTNAITLTPGTNYYSPAALTNGLCCSFKCAASSTGAVTLQLGALGLFPVFQSNNVQATTAGLQNGFHYVVQYWSDLNSSSGGWLIINGMSPAVAGTGVNVGTFSATTTAQPVWSQGYLQYLVNNVPGTGGGLNIAAPTGDGAMLMQITNGSAGAIGITFITGTANFQYTTAGDAYVTSTGAVYLANMWRINGTASYFLRRIL
jgi:hypothetical protein